MTPSVREISGEGVCLGWASAGLGRRGGCWASCGLRWPASPGKVNPPLFFSLFIFCFKLVI
jgi:hypothetical protein